MTGSKKRDFRLRSQDWFDNVEHADMAAIYLERFTNYGLTLEELREGRPIIGIAQSGSDLAPCNRIHVDLARRVKDGIRDAGGIPIEFPMHPIFENGRRPTAALDRNLAYLGLVEILHGYPLDGVVLTTGCDKTTPSALMAAATANLPAIVLSGGPMLDGWSNSERVGSGTVLWRVRKEYAAGKITRETLIERVAASTPSLGHCNPMGTALTMNVLAEALGMSLTGSSTIPAPYKERPQCAYRTGKRAVTMVEEQLKPLDVMTRASFLNAVRVNAAIGGSPNAYPHLMAIARHAGVDLTADDWNAHGYEIPLLANVQPAGEYLGEHFHRAGGVPAIMNELAGAGHLDLDAMTVTGSKLGQNLESVGPADREVIYAYDTPLRRNGGFKVLTGNLFDSAIMKTSAISDHFRNRYLSDPDRPNTFETRAVVFDGSEDYRRRINDPALKVDENCILVVRGAGPVAWPGSAEVVNMQPPDALIREGVDSLPTMGDGRQSGTSGSPSILNASPEAAEGGGLAWLKDGDIIRIDLDTGRCDALVSEDEIARRKQDLVYAVRDSETPWQAMYRASVTQLGDGAVIKGADTFRDVTSRLPRHNH
ncbi:IlvD/Edd family dehydratase [Henriciella sp.]|uniref:IlvD/Edd family dehydratase n=1 Tax=Henriciella sp. TaxID=1968823 RepID=UPI0026091B01|nr:IlvD/Edd family dehydratase [Henriciella sp.]